MGGYYEKIGDLTGVRWIKYHFLPVFWVEETLTDYTAEDIGYINEGESRFVIPWSYGIEPTPNDMIKFEQEFLVAGRGPDKYSLFCVTGVKVRPPNGKILWELKLIIEQSRTTDEIDRQVSKQRVFFDYTKKIYTVEDAQTLSRMMVKNEAIRNNLKQLYDQNSGFYLI